MSGKKGSFTEAENAVLREALRRYRAERELSQGAMGELLGIKQQNVARAERGGGINRTTANALARLMGRRDAEELLLEHGVLAEMQPSPPARSSTGAGWSTRDASVRVARVMSISDVAVQFVLARETDDDARHRPMKWWIGKFRQAELEREADPVIPAPPKSASSIDPATEPPRRRKRA